MLRCPDCGHENADDAKFCSSCGAPLTGEESAASASSGEDSELAAQIAEALKQGRKIEAIKLYREATGVGLKEAKEAVEQVAAQHGLQTTGSGCGSMILLAVSLGGAVYRLLA